MDSRIIGIDLDNTIISYGEAFYELALSKNLIPNNLKKDKVAIRNYLRSQNRDNEFTKLQGLIYGPEIKKAIPFKGFKSVLEKLINDKFLIYIVSHKTKYPFTGEKYNLREYAKEWLIENEVINIKKGLTLNQVFFEDTKEKKIQRILDLKCNYFIDDLPEIIQLIPSNIKGILFDVNSHFSDQDFSKISSWKEIFSKL